MTKYETKAELIEGYAQTMTLEGTELGIARMVAKDKAVYAPHISNLGWFIKGFGFSVERFSIPAPGLRVFNVSAMM